MATIKYLVPYEIAVKAHDIKSGKPITNILYVKTALAVAGPPAYGASVPGGGDTATLLANVATVWQNTFMPGLSANYETEEYVMRSITGKGLLSPAIAITALIPGTPVQIQTSTAHGLTTGGSVRLSGITTPPSLNGDWGVTVISPTQYSLAGSSSATAWSGDGFSQSTAGGSGWLYGDKEVLADIENGVVAGDACPLYCTFSCRRISDAAGRHFRSRLSLGPVAEADNINGKVTTAAATAWATALAALVASPVVLNGGSEVPGSGQSYFGMVSKQLGMAQTSPFTSSNGFFSFTNNYVIRPNCGSLIRRKVKLSASIAS